MIQSVQTYDNFTECYYDLTKSVYQEYDYECKPRGEPIREKIGVSFKIRDPRNRLPYIPERNFSLSYLCAEVLWYFAGRNDVEWIATYSPFWLDVTDDGKTANSSYGSRIFRAHDRIDNGSHIQYQRVLDELKRDPDSRRAVIYLTQPSDHWIARKDIGCALNLQFFIRDGKLHQVANMRSSDLILGIPYDIGAFTMIQEALANDLGVELGEYSHNSASLHIYERNFEVAEAMCNSTVLSFPFGNYPAMPKMPKIVPTQDLIDFENRCRVTQTAEELISIWDDAANIFKDVYWHDWASVFVGHRAKKLSKQLKLKVFDSFVCDGFRKFKK
jgi:thymidylate synthase